MAIVVLLSDRSPLEALPALGELRLDLKTEPLSVQSLGHVTELEPEVVLVDAAENPGQGWAVLRALADGAATVPVVVIAERADLERFSWHETAEDLLLPGAPEAEIRLRLAMLRRRHGAGDATTIRLGPLSLDLDTYRVTASSKPLDLTFKEFELLRFLASKPGRVFTRAELIDRAIGEDVVIIDRNIDVHIRSLRKKLGPAARDIATIRGISYKFRE